MLLKLAFDPNSQTQQRGKGKKAKIVRQYLITQDMVQLSKHEKLSEYKSFQQSSFKCHTLRSENVSESSVLLSEGKYIF